MTRFFFVLIALLFFFCTPVAADEVLDQFGAQLTLNNRLYGGSVSAKELAGRVVVVWNITDTISQLAASSEQNENRDRDNDNDYDRSERRRQDRDNAKSGPQEELKEQTRALRKAAKGALKDGRLLVIAVDGEMPDDPELQRYRKEAIRQLKPAFSVYAIKHPSTLFNAKSNKLFDNFSLTDLAEGTRLTDALAEAPDYTPGRMVLFRTKKHETQAKQFILGKNIEKPLAALKREAAGSNEKALEAREMCTAVEETLDALCATVDSNLSVAPSLAVDNILLLQKTSPSLGRKYQRAVAALRKDAAVQQLSAARRLLAEANNGEMGEADLGRSADAMKAKLTPLRESKNTAVSTEATTLLDLLEPFTSCALAAHSDAVRKTRSERKKQQREAEKKQNEKEDTSRGNNTRPTAYSILSPNGASSFEIFKDELLRLDDATCNYENLRNSYTKYAGQKGEKAEAAEALISTITTNQESYIEELKTIQNNKLPLKLFEKDWERLITVNYPSIGTSPLGRASLKMLRDSEVKRIYGAMDDVLNGEPTRGEEDSTEDAAIAQSQYTVAKLKALQKYRKTTTPLGKMCVAQLDSEGLSNKDIEEKLKSLAETIKEQKKAQKEAEKERKKNERNND